MNSSYLTHFDKLFIVACSYDNVSISGSEGLHQKQKPVIVGPGLGCLKLRWWSKAGGRGCFLKSTRCCSSFQR